MPNLNRYVHCCIRTVSRVIPGNARIKGLERAFRRQLIRRELIDRFPLKGYIISARTDGLLARINSIFNGIIISRHYDKPFKFTWVTGKGSVRSQFLCISESPVSFISQRFWEEHYVEESVARKCAVPWHKTIANCSVVTARTIIRKLSREQFDKQLGEYLNVLADCQLNKGYEQNNVMSQEIFESFFSESIKDKFIRLRNMRDWNQWVAIHYRAGDVIYGRCRFGYHVRKKSLSLPVVEKAILDHHDQNIVIMGTPYGDSLDELMELEKKYPNVRLSPEIASPDSSHNSTSTLCDAYLMSLCKKVICAGSSNMTQFAKRLSGVEIHIPSDQEQKAAMESALASGEASRYTGMQQAFIHYNLFMIHLDDPDCDYEKADGFLRQIRELDPENEVIMLLRFLVAKKHGKQPIAKELKMEMRTQKIQAAVLSEQLRPKVLDKLDFQKHSSEFEEMRT